MHSSQDAASARQSTHATQQRAGDFSFPPIQRTGLLRSTASPNARPRTNAVPTRSADQTVNLARTATHLIDLLSVQPLEHAAAI